MEVPAQGRYQTTAIEAGVDWLTATAPRGLEGRAFREAGNRLLDERRAAGGDVKPAALRDYNGYRGEHVFVGTRERDALIVLSSGAAAEHWKMVSQAARNVSRLDLQVTVWTHGEQPPLARTAYQKLRRSPVGRGRPRSYTLIRTHPQGETLNVGKRSSDAYGRLYDWASAHKAATAATIWRYEVEFKRRYALAHCRALSDVDDPRTSVADVVHRWWSTRSVEPTWSVAGSRFSNGALIREPERDALAWFRSSVSKTVAKAIDRHGLESVILALGLSDVVQPRPRRCKTNAFNPERALQGKAHR